MNIDEKYNNLINHIKSLQSVIVAYSGGVDSTFLMKVCRLTLGKDNVLALTSSSPSRPENEIEEAIQLASENDVEHMVIQTDELRDDQYQHNTIDRCYHCKNHLNASFKAILDEKKKYKFIVNGTNI